MPNSSSKESDRRYARRKSSDDEQYSVLPKANSITMPATYSDFGPRNSSREKKNSVDVKQPIRSIGEWSEFLSSSGKIYFYNSKTEKAQWEKPEIWDWLVQEEKNSKLDKNYYAKEYKNNRYRSKYENDSFDMKSDRFMSNHKGYQRDYPNDYNNTNVSSFRQNSYNNSYNMNDRTGYGMQMQSSSMNGCMGSSSSMDYYNNGNQGPIGNNYYNSGGGNFRSTGNYCSDQDKYWNEQRMSRSRNSSRNDQKMSRDDDLGYKNSSMRYQMNQNYNSYDDSINHVNNKQFMYQKQHTSRYETYNQDDSKYSNEHYHSNFSSSSSNNNNYHYGQNMNYPSNEYDTRSDRFKYSSNMKNSDQSSQHHHHNQQQQHQQPHHKDSNENYNSNVKSSSFSRNNSRSKSSSNLSRSRSRSAERLSNKNSLSRSSNSSSRSSSLNRKNSNNNNNNSYGYNGTSSSTKSRKSHKNSHKRRKYENKCSKYSDYKSKSNSPNNNNNVVTNDRDPDLKSSTTITTGGGGVGSQIATNECIYSNENNKNSSGTIKNQATENKSNQSKLNFKSQNEELSSEVNFKKQIDHVKNESEIKVASIEQTDPTPCNNSDSLAANCSNDTINNLKNNSESTSKSEPSDSNINNQDAIQPTAASNLITEPVLESTLDDINKYFKPDLLNRLSGIDLNENFYLVNNQTFMRHMSCFKLSTELKNFRSLVRIKEIKKTLQEQRLIFLQTQMKEIEEILN